MFLLSTIWSKGKSEVAYRGKNARRMSLQLEQEDGSRSLFVRSLGKTLNVVDLYKHVGSVVQSAGLLIKDAKHRASSALSACAPSAMRVFDSNCIPLARRIALGYAVVVPRLTYNVHVWPYIGGRACACISNVYMKLWRRIVASLRFSNGCYSDLEVRARLHVPCLRPLVGSDASG